MSAPEGRAEIPVLVAADSALWEAAAVERLERRGSGAVLRRRCVDLPDLLAAARTGLGRVAVVAESLAGLDADAVAALHGCGVEVVGVLDGSGDPVARQRLAHLGVRRFVPDHLEGFEEAVRAAAAGPARQDLDDHPGVGDGPVPPLAPSGRVVAVWGPAGAPGRTTIAVSVAAELAHRGLTALLLDADPYGGAVAQHLGVLEEVSGLLAAARAANAGRLDAAALARLCRSVDERMRLLTGLPRADRWVEVRPAAFEEVLQQARTLVDRVVVDVGFSLEEDDDPFTAAPRRNGMTLVTLEQADELVVVGSADPVGLARLARGLVEITDRCPDLPTVVVVNRARPSLGWAEQDVRGMVEGFHRHARVRFVPDDRDTADRGLMAGRSVVELGDSALRRAIADLVDTLASSTPTGGRAPRSRTGRAGRARRLGRGLRSRRAGRAR
ncbi:MAG: CpaE family protein [Actinomycetes bacterium]